MRAAFAVMAAMPLAACVTAEPAVRGVVPAEHAVARLEPVAGGGVMVRRLAAPGYSLSDGAVARREADALCGGRVQSSIYDRVAAGAWIYPEGCA